jgi:hypothetical protein
MPTCSPCATVRSECVHSPSASQHSDTLAGHACIHHFHTDLHVLRWGVGQAQSDWAECTAHAPHKLIINLGAEFFFETSTSFKPHPDVPSPLAASSSAPCVEGQYVLLFCEYAQSQWCPGIRLDKLV